MRGVLIDDATKIMTAETFDKLEESLKEGPFMCSLLLEYYRHDKINSVPANETPYRRNLPGNGIALVVWDDPKPELEVKAKDIVDRLSSLVKVPGMHYGNFSKCGDVSYLMMNLT